LWGLAVRYRRSGPIERRQLKWFAWGSVLTLAGGGALVVGALAVEEPGSRLTDLSWVVFAAASITLPVAALIAILREGLYDIDEIIGRTFVFGVLTAILAGVYAASIRLFNALFIGLTGEKSELALVLTTLVLATTFTPIKSRLEHIAGKRLRSPQAAPTVEIGALSDLPAGDPELDRRIESIARMVSREVLAGSARAERAAQDHDADQDQHERAEQVADAGEARPQA
jgi:hypothetical protein